MRNDHKRRIVNLEKNMEKNNFNDHGLVRYVEAIDGLSKGIPSSTTTIPPERQKEIDEAWAALTDKEKRQIKELVGDCEVGAS